MKRISIICFLLLLGICASAQNAVSDWFRNTYINGALESNSISYRNDKASNATRPEGGFGSNNYLKLDFGAGDFYGGLQMEGYFPQIQGYPIQYEGFSLANRYLGYNNGLFSVTLGDFYDQLGSGLLFRAYEERSLGINTALEGARLNYVWSDKLSVKAFTGFPKLFKAYNYDSMVTAVDFSADLMSFAGSGIFSLYLEESFLNKHQALESEWMEGMVPENVNGTSSRLVFSKGGLSISGEYVARNSDTGAYNNYNSDKSRAILLEGIYAGDNLGVNLTFRKISNAGFQSDHNEATMYTSLNYIPALTQQHTYSLASLNPYQSQMNGEIGGQADVYYHIEKGSFLGGSKGMKCHVNFSTYYGPSPAPEIQKNELYFRDLTLDSERWFGTDTKVNVLYTWQTYNFRVGPHPVYEFRRSHTIVTDITHKFNPRNSLRVEYQHLWSAQGEGNWCAAGVEYNLSPGWSFSINDMWNYGYTRVHYFNGGFSYSRGRQRIALNFGRFREGYQCAGGVCRLIPAYSGANLTLTSSF